MRRCVWVIDDERSVIKFYAWALKDRGFEVLLTEDCDSALAEIPRRTNCHVVILDIMLGSCTSYSDAETRSGLTSGLMILDRLRHLAPQLKVIVLTNVRRAALPDELNGVWTFVQKLNTPPERLAVLVERAFSEGFAEE